MSDVWVEQLRVPRALWARGGVRAAVQSVGVYDAVQGVANELSALFQVSDDGI